jgi:hypothetical protein
MEDESFGRRIVFAIGLHDHGPLAGKIGRAAAEFVIAAGRALLAEQHRRRTPGAARIFLEHASIPGRRAVAAERAAAVDRQVIAGSVDFQRGGRALPAAGAELPDVGARGLHGGDAVVHGHRQRNLELADLPGFLEAAHEIPAAAGALKQEGSGEFLRQCRVATGVDDRAAGGGHCEVTVDGNVGGKSFVGRIR